MKVYLAGVSPFLKLVYNEICKCKSAYILESFYYMDEDMEKAIPTFKDFLLDSGAFTFFSGKHSNVDWDDYVDRYADFINRNNIKHFFELDIDSIVGYDKVIKIRERLEKRTSKQSIPVFHLSRGIAEYKNLCNNYKYIAIGCSGKHDSRWTREHPDKLKKLVLYAKCKGVDVHGLGFTSLVGLKQIPFYSVDSTSWVAGNRFGCIYKFSGDTIIKFDKKQGQRLANSKKTALNNFVNWLKFQKYMDYKY